MGLVPPRTVLGLGEAARHWGLGPMVWLVYCTMLPFPSFVSRGLDPTTTTTNLLSSQGLNSSCSVISIGCGLILRRNGKFQMDFPSG